MRPLIVTLLIFALLIPHVATALRITEVQPNPASGPEYVELWLSGEGGNLTLNDSYGTDTVAVPDGTTGLVIVAPTAAGLEGLSCPVLSLDSPIGNGLANSGDGITVTLNGSTDSFSYSGSERGKSYNRCPDCGSFTLGDPTPCAVSIDSNGTGAGAAGNSSSGGSGDSTGSTGAGTSGSANETSGTTAIGGNATGGANADQAGNDTLCEPPTIEADPIQQDRIEYRIRSSEAYEYWIEDAFGNVVRERASSSTSAIKRYTPSAQHEDETYLIRARTSCGSAQLAVGFTTPSLPSCVPTEDQVIAAITDSIAIDICRPHIEEAAACEDALDTCRNPEPAMTSFYTLARNAADSYAYRSTAKANATYYACVARLANATNGSIVAELSDTELARGRPLLIAFENETVVDARFGEVPSFVGISNEPSSGSAPVDGNATGSRDNATARPARNATGDANGTRGNGASGGAGEATAPWSDVQPRYVRAIRALWNRVRTSRGARSAQPWLVPVSFGIGGLSLALERT